MSSQYGELGLRPAGVPVALWDVACAAMAAYGASVTAFVNGPAMGGPGAAQTVPVS